MSRATKHPKLPPTWGHVDGRPFGAQEVSESLTLWDRYALAILAGPVPWFACEAGGTPTAAQAIEAVCNAADAMVAESEKRSAIHG